MIVPGEIPASRRGQAGENNKKKGAAEAAPWSIDSQFA
jgi:hypothetical protein